MKCSGDYCGALDCARCYPLSFGQEPDLVEANLSPLYDYLCDQGVGVTDDMRTGIAKLVTELTGFEG